MVATVVGRRDSQRVHHAAEQRPRRLDHHDARIETIGEEKIRSGRERGAIEQFVHVLQDERVGVEQDEAIEVDELEGAELGEHAGKSRKELPIGGRIGDGIDFTNLPPSRGQSLARRGTDVGRCQDDSRRSAAARLQRLTEHLYAGQITISVTKGRDVGLSHRIHAPQVDSSARLHHARSDPFDWGRVRQRKSALRQELTAQLRYFLELRGDDGLDSRAQFVPFTVVPEAELDVDDLRIARSSAIDADKRSSFVGAHDLRVGDRLSAPQRIEVHPGDAVAVAAALARIQPMPAPLLDPQARGTAEARLHAAEDARTQAEATVERARAALDFAKSELERTRSLAAGGTVPARQLEQAEFEVRSGEATLRSAQFALEVAGHEVEFARAALGELQPGRADRRAFAVRSPIEGHVLRVERESEGPVVPGTPLLELGDLSAFEVVADVLTRDAEQLQRGLPVLIGHAGEGKEFAGHIRRVEPAAFTRVSRLGVEEQRVNVLVDLLRPEEVKLGDGFAVDVRFVISDDPRVLQVPASALFRVSEGWGAFAVQNGRAALRLVKPGKRNPLQVEVLSGLSEGDTVILHPGELVRDGVRVETR